MCNYLYALLTYQSLEKENSGSEKMGVARLTVCVFGDVWMVSDELDLLFRRERCAMPREICSRHRGCFLKDQQRARLRFSGWLWKGGIG